MRKKEDLVGSFTTTRFKGGKESGSNDKWMDDSASARTKQLHITKF